MDAAAGRVDLQRCVARADHTAECPAALLPALQFEIAAQIAADGAGVEMKAAIFRQLKIHVARDRVDRVRPAARQAPIVLDSAAGCRDRQLPILRVGDRDVARDTVQIERPRDTLELDLAAGRADADAVDLAILELYIAADGRDS